MSYPVAITSGPQRSMDAIDNPKRQRLNSDEGVKSKESGNLLPFEIWEKIACYLDRCALVKFSQLSKLHYSASLAPFNLLTKSVVSQELQTLARLEPLESKRSSRLLECYLSIFNDLYDFGCFSQRQEHANDPEVLSNLQKQLLEWSQDHIEKKLCFVSQKCFQDIKKNKVSFEDIEKEYISAKTCLVLQALNLILSKACSHEEARMYALANAARMNCYEVVDFLLFKDRTEPCDVGFAVVCAASANNWDMLLYLISNGTIDDVDRGNAALVTLSYDNLEIVKKLIFSGPITDVYRDLIIKEAKQLGYQEIVEILSAKDSNATIELA